MKPLYDDFMNVARKVVESNLDNDSFGCPELCDNLRMSRSHVHRKLKAATNLSTSDFIKHIRLEKAKEMLLSTNQSVSQVAYKVGYSDANYFSRSFSKIYGIPPSQYRQPMSL
jgi:AraC-like DNA-binding protein